MGLLPANELSYISTIIKAAAATRDWNAALGSKKAGKVQEVQCMRVKGKLLIAGNYDQIDEGEAIKSYLASFGVGNGHDFVTCMQYSHELLALDSPRWIRVNKDKELSDPAYKLLQVKVDAHAMPSYSGQDNLVIQGFAEARPIFLAGGFDDDDLGTIMDLVAKPRASGPARTAPQQNLAWFLRHFLGVSEASGALKAAARPSGFAGSLATCGDVGVVKSMQGVHAELVLLSFLAREVLTNPNDFFGETVYLGGSKNACQFCNSWMGHYRKWIKQWFSVNVVLPFEYTHAIEDLARPHGRGSGSRPSLAGVGYAGEFATALFNGAAGGNCADLEDSSTKLMDWVD
ncbi:hypothetical protein JVX91_17335 [Pseudomonas sp. PDNC002]|uniref:hypothetical protein n=1 Tax=Pseudomonas sp. PDNC002 TaxID=2811422 RepID=UPI001963F211|nr:hypothetical protein [Pseudomonas sp. PDNC002]QRY77371.1 hypothetical protein JVX91_17335 [Pseudomonas sp. PDNC002]